jgi:AcrR family transcriptional regulator
MKNEPETRRPRGRPRSTSVDSALVKAALDEFTANGFHAMSMESIAARARVSKVSLYRRWSSKLAVAADVLRLLSETSIPEDHGSLEADILALLEASIGSPKAKSAAKVFMRTMGEISSNPELLALYRTHLLAPRIEQIRALVARARARNEIRDALPTEIAAATIAGPLFLYYLTVLANADGQWPHNLVEELMGAILQGIGAERKSPLHETHGGRPRHRTRTSHS